MQSDACLRKKEQMSFRSSQTTSVSATLELKLKLDYKARFHGRIEELARFVYRAIPPNLPHICPIQITSQKKKNKLQADQMTFFSFTK